MSNASEYLQDKSLMPLYTKARSKQVFLGFDAYIDTITKPIQHGNSISQWSCFKDISSFGQHIVNKDGENCSIELQENSTKFGGNMPITANAISNFGVKAYCVGPLGYPKIKDIFHNMNSLCTLITVGQPGECVALEFNNGKIMLGLNKGVNEIDFAVIKEKATIEKLTDCVKNSDVLCFLNWSELPHATDIFKGMNSEIFSKFSDKKHLLIDLSDCSRRSQSEQKEIFDVIANFPKNILVTLSLNKNEENILCKILDISSTNNEIRGEQILEKLSLHQVIFHNSAGNSLFKKAEKFFQGIDICKTPKATVGAGDNFNAGVIMGLIMELSSKKLLEFATKTAEYYINNGKSFNINN